MIRDTLIRFVMLDGSIFGWVVLSITKNHIFGYHFYKTKATKMTTFPKIKLR